jgi:hypothetical protein
MDRLDKSQLFRTPNCSLTACLLFVFVCLGQASIAHSQTSVSSSEVTMSSTESLAEKSTVIFEGLVTQLHSTTIPEIPATDTMVVVRVEEIVHAPTNFPNLRGQQITVELAKPGAVREGEKSVFFTNGWVFGRQVAVREVGHTPLPSQPAAFQEELSKWYAQQDTRLLERRLIQANVVIVGKVRKAQRSTQASAHFISEHSPDWWEATIEVTSVERGELSQKPILVYFPNSSDVVWRSAPKFLAEQEGIWILHRQKIPGLEPGGHTALDPMDYQNIDQLERVRALIRTLKPRAER